MARDVAHARHADLELSLPKYDSAVGRSRLSVHCTGSFGGLENPISQRIFIGIRLRAIPKF